MRIRFARSLVSLAVAYSLLGALFVGSIAAGRAAASPAPICGIANVGDRGSAPVPVSRDLACLVSGCCCCPASSLAPSVRTLVSRAPSRIAWLESFHLLPVVTAPDGAEARAPPVFS